MTEIKALAEEYANKVGIKSERLVVNTNAYEIWKDTKDAFEAGYKAALSGTEAMKVLESLTPGGSEYYNDPKACADFIRDNRDGLHKQIVNLTRQLKAGTERIECYLPVSVEEVYEARKKGFTSDYHKNIELDTWMKKVTLTVVRESDLVASDNKSSNTACDAPVDNSNSVQQEAWNWWRSIGERRRMELGLSNYGKTLEEIYIANNQS